LIELSEQDDNRAAAVTATAKLMSEADQQDSTAAQRSAPGLVVVIQTGPAVSHALPNVQTIEHDTQEVPAAQRDSET
jgi:hypothetical protein